jgi:uncharacterized protein
MDAMSPLWWTSGLMVGFMGSMHCVGMCGPIALALPAHGNAWLNRLMYNSGRLLTYTTLGFLAGRFGQLVASAGFQRSLSIIAGVFMLVFAVVLFSGSRSFKLPVAFLVWSRIIKDLFRRLFGMKSRTTALLIGAVNGLLPCGFVYLAAIGAATAHQAADGALYMLLFGAGTVPAMVAASLAGGFIGTAWRRRMNSLAPLVAALLAIILLYRGIHIEPAACCQRP